MVVSDLTGIPIDICDAGSVRSAKERIAGQTDRPDTLVNNAGILGRTPQTASPMDAEAIPQVFNTNFFGRSANIF